MTEKEKILALLDASQDGTVTSEQVTANGIHRGALQRLVDKGDLVRYRRGIYVRNKFGADEYFILQRKYGRGVYSHETALYLQGLIDQAPEKITMTFPRGYNAASLKQENILIRIPMNLNDILMLF